MVGSELRLGDPQPPPDPSGSPEKRNVALAERRHVQGWADPDWQRLWLSVHKLPWRALALIPAGEGGPPGFTLNLAVTLSRTGMAHVGSPVLVADGTQVPLSLLNAFIADVHDCTKAGERVLVALPAADSSPTTPAIAKAADGVLLCVLLTRMLSADAKRTVKLIGASKFMGSVIIQPDDMQDGR